MNSGGGGRYCCCARVVSWGKPVQQGRGGGGWGVAATPVLSLQLSHITGCKALNHKPTTLRARAQRQQHPLPPTPAHLPRPARGGSCLPEQQPCSAPWRAPACAQYSAGGSSRTALVCTTALTLPPAHSWQQAATGRDAAAQGSADEQVSAVSADCTRFNAQVVEQARVGTRPGRARPRRATHQPWPRAHLLGEVRGVG